MPRINLLPWREELRQKRKKDFLLAVCGAVMMGGLIAYGTKLVDEMRAARLDTPVFMGGVLNEDIEGSDVPVDVRQDLRKVGIHTPDSIDDLLAAMEDARSANP